LETVEFVIATPRAQGALPRSPFRTWTLPDGTRSTEFYRLGARYLLRFPGFADFEVSADGLAVTCRPTPGTTEATSRHLYLNQVLPLVLGRLGQMVFHASAVEADGSALAFVAKSAGGKSTLAASFGAAGAAVITDESLVLEELEDGYRVVPGHPSVRLWDDSERELLGAGVEAEPPLPFTPKRRILAGRLLRFSARSMPLRRVYFLGAGQAPVVTLERMSAPEVMLELVKTSFLLNVDDRSRLTSHFDAAARLARRPIHYRLDYPRRFDLLPEVRQAVLEHARDESAS
jgi:hypothetical protein